MTDKEGVLCADCLDTGWLENRVDGRYPCTCISETEPYQLLQAQVDFLRADSAAAWDKCEERRLENEALTAQLKTANERAEYALQNQGIIERARVEEMRKRDLAEKDSARLNYLERNPRHAQIMIDGVVRDCVFYGISTAELTPIRQAIDTILAEIAKGN